VPRKYVLKNNTSSWEFDKKIRKIEKFENFRINSSQFPRCDRKRPHIGKYFLKNGSSCEFDDKIRKFEKIRKIEKFENLKILKNLESIPHNFLAELEKGHISGNTFLKMDQVVSI
jgi:hypothetical protein